MNHLKKIPSAAGSRMPYPRSRPNILEGPRPDPSVIMISDSESDNECDNLAEEPMEIAPGNIIFFPETPSSFLDETMREENGDPCEESNDSIQVFENFAPQMNGSVETELGDLTGNLGASIPETVLGTNMEMPEPESNLTEGTPGTSEDILKESLLNPFYLNFEELNQMYQDINARNDAQATAQNAPPRKRPPRKPRPPRKKPDETEEEANTSQLRSLQTESSVQETAPTSTSALSAPRIYPKIAPKPVQINNFTLNKSSISNVNNGNVNLAPSFNLANCISSSIEKIFANVNRESTVNTTAVNLKGKPQTTSDVTLKECRVLLHRLNLKTLVNNGASIPSVELFLKFLKMEKERKNNSSNELKPDHQKLAPKPLNNNTNINLGVNKQHLNSISFKGRKNISIKPISRSTGVELKCNIQNKLVNILSNNLLNEVYGSMGSASKIYPTIDVDGLINNCEVNDMDSHEENSSFDNDVIHINDENSHRDSRDKSVDENVTVNSKESKKNDLKGVKVVINGVNSDLPTKTSTKVKSNAEVLQEKPITSDSRNRLSSSNGFSKDDINSNPILAKTINAERRSSAPSSNGSSADSGNAAADVSQEKPFLVNFRSSVNNKLSSLLTPSIVLDDSSPEKLTNNHANVSSSVNTNPQMAEKERIDSFVNTLMSFLPTQNKPTGPTPKLKNTNAQVNINNGLRPNGSAIPPTTKLPKENKFISTNAEIRKNVEPPSVIPLKPSQPPPKENIYSEYIDVKNDSSKPKGPVVPLMSQIFKENKIAEVKNALKAKLKEPVVLITKQSTSEKAKMDAKSISSVTINNNTILGESEDPKKVSSNTQVKSRVDPKLRASPSILENGNCRIKTKVDTTSSRKRKASESLSESDDDSVLDSMSSISMSSSDESSDVENECSSRNSKTSSNYSRFKLKPFSINLQDCSRLLNGKLVYNVNSDSDVPVPEKDKSDEVCASKENYFDGAGVFVQNFYDVSSDEDCTPIPKCLNVFAVDGTYDSDCDSSEELEEERIDLETAAEINKSSKALESARMNKMFVRLESKLFDLVDINGSVNVRIFDRLHLDGNVDSHSDSSEGVEKTLKKKRKAPSRSPKASPAKKKRKTKNIAHKLVITEKNSVCLPVKKKSSVDQIQGDTQSSPSLKNIMRLKNSDEKLIQMKPVIKVIRLNYDKVKDGISVINFSAGRSTSVNRRKQGKPRKYGSDANFGQENFKSSKNLISDLHFMVRNPKQRKCT